MRPLKGYYCHSDLPSLGSYVDASLHIKITVKILEKTILVSFLLLQTSIKIINLFLGMSGGIDSEVCAETFYQLKYTF